MAGGRHRAAFGTGLAGLVCLAFAHPVAGAAKLVKSGSRCETWRSVDRACSRASDAGRAARVRGSAYRAVLEVMPSESISPQICPKVGTIAEIFDLNLRVGP